MATFRVELSSASNRDNQFAVRIRITSERKHKRVSLGFYIAKKDFNPRGTLDKSNWVRASCPQYIIYNSRIKERMELAQKAINDISKTSNPTLEQLYIVVSRNELTATQQSFIEYYQEQLAIVEVRLSIKTSENYGVPLRKMIEMLKLKEKSNLYFSELTPRFLKEFETYMLRNNARNTVSKQLGYVKTIVNQAISDKILSKDQNPFDGFKFVFNPTERLKLTEEEMKQLEELPLDPKFRVCHARDIFLFMYYTHGMRIGDALFVKTSSIYKDGEVYRMKFQMQKTKLFRDVLLTDKAVKIINKYITDKEGNSFLFPFLKNGLNYEDKRVFKTEKEAKTSIVNNNLKKVAALLGWDFKLTCHIARHTFADGARVKGINAYSISKALGHMRLSTTEQYLKSFDQSAVDKVNEMYE